MMNGRKYEWWKAALLSGAISGIVGPGVGTAIQLLSNAYAVNFLGALIGFLNYWFAAVVIFGAVAFVLGCVGGVLLKALTTKCNSMWPVVVIAATLGVSLGSVVPFGAVVLGTLIDRGSLANNNWDATKALVGTGAVAGLLCAIVVLWSLRVTGVLHLSSRESYAALSE